MNGEIFLRWLDSKELETTLSLLVQWFLRVLIWCLIIVDIPKLPSDVIRFRDRSFKYTYSLRSFSMLLFVSHHVMLLLSNRSLKAKVITYNPHHLFFLSITIHLGDYYSLNNQLYNHNRICVIALNYEMQGFTHSFSGETRRLRKGYVKSRIPWVSFSQNASGSLINVFHKLQWLTNRVVGKLLTLTSLRLTSLLSFEWYNKYGHPITHSWFIYKDSLIPDLKYVNRNWWILRWNGEDQRFLAKSCVLPQIVREWCLLNYPTGLHSECTAYPLYDLPIPMNRIHSQWVAGEIFKHGGILRWDHKYGFRATLWLNTLLVTQNYFLGLFSRILPN